MSIQAIINTAQSIEASRSALVATSMSRSGRLFTGARNWAKPWRFTITPKPIFSISEGRAIIEAIMNYDKHSEQTVKLGQGSAAWLTAYQGAVTVSAGNLVGITVASATGTTMVINYTGLSNGQIILQAGDIIQPVGHRYPYVVQTTVTATGATGTANVLLNRGYLPQTGYTLAGAALTVGTDCSWRVKVSKLPTYRFLPGQLVEFTEEFELIESVI